MSALNRPGDWRKVPIPDRMQRLDRDKRGFPIPFLVLRDPDGKPNFTINDSAKRAQCLRDDLCAICGRPLFRGRWFVGGAASAFHERGAYLDTPLHDECAHYALEVCPYLAVSKYTGRIDDANFAWDKHPDKLMLVDETMIPERPEVFVAVMAVSQTLVGPPHAPYVKPGRPYRRVEFWRHGEEIPEIEGMRYVKAALAALDVDKARAVASAPPRRIPRRAPA